ncbi:hypothetical protein JTE90_014797 [Oedothorax gibbosus]|uniref:Uncharacterized protein n=1 Tax=Oedothorax gibbosus TaxID=931172 RepID=A0AAV6TF51_9ARAC|nr:hypothetical protein JTE90_014797 [Oedothorax gibbosus]
MADAQTEMPASIQLVSRFRDEGFAAVAVDDTQCVVVMDTVWFRVSPQEPDWERTVMDALRSLNVKTVYVPYGAMTLKRAADETMNVIVAERPFELRFPCSQCMRNKSCAVTKAYLVWRQHAKRTPCNLIH